MALDSRVVICPALDQFFINRDTALPLANGTLSFFRDTQRTTLKPIYQLSGAPGNYEFIPFVTNPVVLSAVGTIVNGNGDSEVIYLFPFEGKPGQNNSDSVEDLYFVVCKDENGVEQWTREGWPAGAFTDINDVNDLTGDNQISNPQFTKVFINENAPTVYTVVVGPAQTFSFAPGWDFVASGTGNITVTRIPNGGVDKVPTNPPFILDVQVDQAITSCKLVQRFNANSGLWTASGISGEDSIRLSTTLVARSASTHNEQILVYYQASSGDQFTDPIELLNQSVSINSYEILKNVSDTIPADTDVNVGNNGFVDIYFSFVGGAHVLISSVQIIPLTNSDNETAVDYQLNSSNRNLALMGDYYIPALSNKAIPSLLTGWDFPLNPTQFGIAGSMTNIPKYIWDQTIAASSSTANNYTKDVFSTGDLQITTGAANQSFYLLQYLTGPQAMKLIGTPLSVNVNAWSSLSGVKVNVHLYQNTTAVKAFVATAAVLSSSVSYNNGTAGVGATLTNTGPLVQLVVDGVTVSAAFRVLVKNQADNKQNGVYIVTNPGAVGVAWVLTRSTDFNTPAQLNNKKLVSVLFGNTNTNLSFVQTATVNTIGTDAITYANAGAVPLLSTSPYTIGSINDAGVFTLNTTSGYGANWSEIPRSGLPTASANLTVGANIGVVNGNVDYGFNGWEIVDPALLSNIGSVAIVVTFTYPNVSTVIEVNSISLVPGDIPTRPAPQTYDQVLQECLYYYETSYEINTPIPSATLFGSVVDIMAADSAGSNCAVAASAFELEFKTLKRLAAPNITFYPITGSPPAAGNVSAFAQSQSGRSAGANAAITSWTGTSSTHGVSYIPTSTTGSQIAATGGLGLIQGWIRYQYVVDARLGII